MDYSGSEQYPLAGCSEHGNEFSVSIKGGEFLNSVKLSSAGHVKLLYGVKIKLSYFSRLAHPSEV